MGNINLLKSLWSKYEFKLDTLENRIIFQKTIYLLQELGLNIGYKFNWYIYGPYSSQLASDGFELERKQETKDFSPVRVEKSITSKFDKLIDKNSSTWYEFLSSILFLKNKKETKEKIFKQLAEHQSYLGDYETFEIAWKKLESAGLI